jgi:hypothetical protein
VSRTELPTEIRRFILTSIPSVPYLEAMLLLRAEPARDWTSQAVAQRLYLPEPQAGDLLSALARAGVAAQADSGAARWSPATPELARMLDEVARHYAANLVGVSSLIHSRVDKRAQQFADAFRWRKDS